MARLRKRQSPTSTSQTDEEVQRFLRAADACRRIARTPDAITRRACERQARVFAKSARALKRRTIDKTTKPARAPARTKGRDQ